jgi:hypothetical protein
MASTRPSSGQPKPPPEEVDTGQRDRAGGVEVNILSEEDDGDD